jgi:hypothetical protein
MKIENVIHSGPMTTKTCLTEGATEKRGKARKEVMIEESLDNHHPHHPKSVSVQTKPNEQRKLNELNHSFLYMCPEKH